jgi:Transglycosylase-like domain
MQTITPSARAAQSLKRAAVAVMSLVVMLTASALPASSQEFDATESGGGIIHFTAGEAPARTVPESIYGAAAIALDPQGGPGDYWITTDTGQVTALGEAADLGSAGSISAAIVGMSATATGQGYWLVGLDGEVYAFGDASDFGSMGGIALNKPIVGMAATATGQGYWLAATDGGIFAFGDAGFFGSTGAMTLNSPIVGGASSATGQGYWLVGADGGIFAFGDATFLGSMGAEPLNEPVVGMSATKSGSGYWLVASDGGVFSFGDAEFVGSGVDLVGEGDVVDLAPLQGVDGYVLAVRPAEVRSEAEILYANLSPQRQRSWERLAYCESKGNWSINTRNGYYGGLQFSLSTWRNVGGVGYPHQATKEEQILRGEILLESYGWRSWPACSRKLGLR